MPDQGEHNQKHEQVRADTNPCRASETERRQTQKRRDHRSNHRARRVDGVKQTDLWPQVFVTRHDMPGKQR
jgi:hypothetical protein